MRWHSWVNKTFCILTFSAVLSSYETFSSLYFHDLKCFSDSGPILSSTWGRLCEHTNKLNSCVTNETPRRPCYVLFHQCPTLSGLLSNHSSTSQSHTPLSFNMCLPWTRTLLSFDVLPLQLTLWRISCKCGEVSASRVALLQRPSWGQVF